MCERSERALRISRFVHNLQTVKIILHQTFELFNLYYHYTHNIELKYHVWISFLGQLPRRPPPPPPPTSTSVCEWYRIHLLSLILIFVFSISPPLHTIAAVSDPSGRERSCPAGVTGQLSDWIRSARYTAPEVPCFISAKKNDESIILIGWFDFGAKSKAQKVRNNWHLNSLRSALLWLYWNSLFCISI